MTSESRQRVCLLTGATLGKLGTLPAMHELLRALFAESAAVADRLGIKPTE